MPGLSAKIFRQAFLLAKGHKVFWGLGLFLSWLAVGKVMLLAFTLSQLMPSAGPTPAPPAPPEGNALTWAAINALLIFAAAAIMHFRSKSILMFTVKELRDKRDADRQQVRDMAEPYTIRLLKAGFMFGLAAVLVGLVFLPPVQSLSAGNWGATQYLALFSLVLVAVPAVLVLYLVSIFTPLFLALWGMPAYAAFQSAVDLIRRRTGTIITFTGISLVLEVIGLALASILGVAVFSAVVLLDGIFYDNGGLAAAIEGLVKVLAFVVFFMSLAWFTSFQKIAWTILFLEIVRPVPTEEEPETEPVAEIAT